MRRWWYAIPAEAGVLIGTRALRGFADGAVSVLLPVYLARIGFSALGISAIVFGTLLGSAALTLSVGLLGYRSDPRRILLGAAALMLATGVGFFSLTSFWPLFFVAVVGTLNPSAGDVSLFLPAEQSLIAEAVPIAHLTRIFALYNLGGALAGALGALAAGLPSVIAAQYHLPAVVTERCVFLVYAACALPAATLYLRLGPRLRPSADPVRPLGRSRAIVIRLAALFSLDAFGGGFVVQSMLALWLLRRFALPAATVGAFFFAANACGALAQLASGTIAARIGRVRTMVYTHIPSNGCLIVAALMDRPAAALAFLFLRAATSSMDVPARQSYVMAMVTPEERAAAASVTAVPRSLAAALAPLPAGAMLEATAFGWPLVCAGALKLAYDLLLLAQFRSARPADEQPTTA